MGCNCNGGAGSSGDQYQAIAQDGTVQPIDTTRMSGTLAEARAVVSGMPGGWVKKAAASS